MRLTNEMLLANGRRLVFAWDARYKCFTCTLKAGAPRIGIGHSRVAALVALSDKLPHNRELLNLCAECGVKMALPSGRGLSFLRVADKRFRCYLVSDAGNVIESAAGDTRANALLAVASKAYVRGANSTSPRHQRYQQGVWLEVYEMYKQTERPAPVGSHAKLQRATDPWVVV